MTHEFDTRTFAPGDLITAIEKKIQNSALTQIRVRVATDLEADSISRFLHTQGFEVGVDAMGMDTWVEGYKDPERAKAPSKASPDTILEDALVLISSSSLGPDDDQLGRNLMTRFLATLAKRTCLPAVIALVHEGVHLSQNPSQARPHLQTLTDQGVTLLICRTSANHSGIGTPMGQVVPFERIAEAILTAAKVTRL